MEPWHASVPRLHCHSLHRRIAANACFAGSRVDLTGMPVIPLLRVP